MGAQQGQGGRKKSPTQAAAGVRCPPGPGPFPAAGGRGSGWKVLLCAVVRGPGLPYPKPLRHRSKWEDRFFLEGRRGRGATLSFLERKRKRHGACTMPAWCCGHPRPRGPGLSECPESPSGLHGRDVAPGGPWAWAANGVEPGRRGPRVPQKVSSPFERVFAGGRGGIDSRLFAEDHRIRGEAWSEAGSPSQTRGREGRQGHSSDKMLQSRALRPEPGCGGQTPVPRGTRGPWPRKGLCCPQF